MRPVQQYGSSSGTSESDELGRLREQVTRLERSVIQKEDSLSALSTQVGDSTLM
jgi:hypothetical protein